MFCCDGCGAWTPETCRCPKFKVPTEIGETIMAGQVSTVGELLAVLKVANPDVKLTKKVNVHLFCDPGHGGWQVRVMEA